MNCIRCWHSDSSLELELDNSLDDRRRFFPPRLSLNLLDSLLSELDEPESDELLDSEFDKLFELSLVSLLSDELDELDEMFGCPSRRRSCRRSCRLLMLSTDSDDELELELELEDEDSCSFFLNLKMDRTRGVDLRPDSLQICSSCLICL
jgi:hypothetical protein